MSWKTLEKSGLEPTAPTRQADRKHCALSIQPNPHLLIGDAAFNLKGFIQVKNWFNVNLFTQSLHSTIANTSLHGA